MEKRVLNKGERFGFLTVIREVEPAIYGRSYTRRILCSCDCGNETIVRLPHLLRGATKSCGCYRSSPRLDCRKYKNREHLKRLYIIWGSMKARCYQKTAKSYKDYGERGISVCEEWKNDFLSFYNWAISNGYSDKLTLDRIDNNSGYEPSNCRWVTHKIQENNRRCVPKYTYNGMTHTITEWSELLGINAKALRKRIRILGWPIDKAFCTPLRNKK